jgi:dihydropteroate synthase
MGYIDRQLFENLRIGDFSPVIIMGVINLSPESFYKDSFVSKEKLLKKFMQFKNNGAKIIDIGARSTAPGVKPITIEEEKQRIEAALEILSESPMTGMILSIDTQYAAIAEYALNFAQNKKISLIINDVSSFQTDPNLLDVVVKWQCPVIIMATDHKPGDAKTIHGILNALGKTIDQLRAKKYDLSKLIVDPAVGKWSSEKTYEYDLEILDQLECFRCFGIPILVGLSRKSFLGSVLNEPDPSNRQIGSLAATSIAVYNGAHIIRTHDVDPNTIQTIITASAIRKKPIIKSKGNQRCEIISSPRNVDYAYHLLKRYWVTPAGSRIMDKKMVQKTIILRNLTAPQSLILKEELLARGGDVALHRDVITTEWQKYEEKFDVVLIGTVKQMESLVQKLKGQQLKLDLIARLIEEALQDEFNTKKMYAIPEPIK